MKERTNALSVKSPPGQKPSHFCLSNDVDVTLGIEMRQEASSCHRSRGQLGSKDAASNVDILIRDHEQIDLLTDKRVSRQAN